MNRNRDKYSNVFNKGEDIIEIKITDPAGNKIDTKRCKVSDKAELTRILNLIKSKYNVKIDDDWLSPENEFLKF